MTKLQMQIVINHHELRIRELEKNICIYARENMGFIDFYDDKEANDKAAIKYFEEFPGFDSNHNCFN